MKSKTKILTSVVGLFSALTLTTALGQVTYTWTNQTPANTAAPGDLGTSANWRPSDGSPVAIPSPTTGPGGIDGLTYGDEMLWDGATTGELFLTANQNQTGFSGQPWGLRWRVSSNQTSRVNVRSLVAVSAGTRSQNFMIESGAGGLTLGDHSENSLDVLMGGTNPQNHGFTNDSSNPAIINETVRWRMGGGGAHFYQFAGTGDWIVNNRLRSQNNAAIVVQKFGSGTMTWTATNVPNSLGPDNLGTPVTIAEGMMILKSFDCIHANQGIVNNAYLKYDASVGAATFPGNFSGAGTLEVSAGQLSLANANSTFSGGFVLSGGKLVAGVTENVGISGPLGIGGIISFSGGTLGFSANNTFDYSARFSTAAGQAYSFDTAGQSVTFSNNLESAGATLVKLGDGSLTLAGNNTYSGLTTVSGGTLVLQGPKTGAGNVTVADGATLDVFNNGTQVTPVTLTLGTSAGANLEFDNVSSTSTAPLAAGTIASAGMTVVSINSGTFSIGQSYPLISWTSGPAPEVSLGIVDGAGGTLTTNGNTIGCNCS